MVEADFRTIDTTFIYYYSLSTLSRDTLDGSLFITLFVVAISFFLNLIIYNNLIKK
jgi:hypothetical protein